MSDVKRDLHELHGTVIAMSTARIQPHRPNAAVFSKGSRSLMTSGHVEEESCVVQPLAGQLPGTRHPPTIYDAALRECFMAAARADGAW